MIISAEQEFLKTLSEAELQKYRQKCSSYSLNFDEYTEIYALETIENVSYMTEDELEEFLFSEQLYQTGWDK